MCVCECACTQSQLAPPTGPTHHTFDSLVMRKELNELRGVPTADHSDELVDTLGSRGQDVVLHLWL